MIAVQRHREVNTQALTLFYYEIVAYCKIDRLQTQYINLASVSFPFEKNHCQHSYCQSSHYIINQLLLQ